MSASTGLRAPPRRSSTVRRVTPAHLAAWLAAAALAAGCGGGKKSDGFEVAPPELSFAAGEQDALPAGQFIQLTITNPDAAYLGAAFLDGAPGWIALGEPSGAGASWTIPISVTTTALAPGPHVATLTVGIANADEELLARREVRITYTVSARLRTDTAALAFTAYQSDGAPPPQAVGVLGTAIGWTASADAPWIHLGPTDGVGPRAITVAVDHAGLAIGSHQGLVTIQAAGGGAVVQVAVSLQVKPVPLTLGSSEALFFADEQGALPPAMAVQVSVADPDAAAVVASAVGLAPGWLSIGAPTGAGASWSVPVAVATTALPPGTYAATLQVGIVTGGGATLATRDVAVSYTVRARLRPSVASLAFSATELGAAPAPQTIGVTGTGIAWTASAFEPWVHLGTTAGTGPGSIAVTVDHAGLAPGEHQAQVTVRAVDGSDAVVVTVSLEVAAAALTVSQPALSFSGVNGTALPFRTLTIGLDSGGAVAWTATSSAPWIRPETDSGTTPGQLRIWPNPSVGALASGTHQGTVTITAMLGGRTLTATVPVSLTLTKPVLTVTPAALALGGPTGRDLSAGSVSLSLSTGDTVHGWTATPSQAWLVPSAPGGVVSATPVAFAVAPSPAGLAGGTHAATLALQATVNGDLVTASLPVTLDLDDRRLLVSDTGVALAKTPTLAALTRTLTVRDNFGAPTAWLAAADQPWLTVTASGTAPGDLTIAADPAGLAADALHEATVTITAAVTDGRPPELVKVGLWIGSADPAPATTLSSSGYSSLALDPVRPYAYVHSGGSAITVYNVFTAEVVATMAAVGAALGDMTVSNDGATLFVSDRTNYRIVPVALATRTKGTPFPVGAAVGPNLHYSRTNGRGLVLTGNGCIFDAASGAVAWPAGGCTGTGYAAVSSSLRGNIFSGDMLIRPLDSTAARGGALLVGEYRVPAVTAWNTADYAFDEDGTRMYLAVKSPYDFYVADCSGTVQSMPQVQTLPGSPYPNNIEVARDGRIFGASSPYGPNAWIYAPDGTQVARWDIAYLGVLDRMLRVSGDGLRLVALVETSGGSATGLAFTTVAP